jgi:plasmid stabilization system protein ParE
MVNISYSTAAKRDLEQIGDYIAETLKSPIAALKTVNKIQDAIDNLADFPLIGTPLSSIVEIDTDYRFLVCSNYLVFYRFKINAVFIDRVLYVRRDYLSILFSDLVHDEVD